MNKKIAWSAAHEKLVPLQEKNNSSNQKQGKTSDRSQLLIEPSCCMFRRYLWLALSFQSNVNDPKFHADNTCFKPVGKKKNGRFVPFMWRLLRLLFGNCCSAEEGINYKPSPSSVRLDDWQRGWGVESGRERMGNVSRQGWQKLTIDIYCWSSSFHVHLHFSLEQMTCASNAFHITPLLVFGTQFRDADWRNWHCWEVLDLSKEDTTTLPIVRRKHLISICLSSTPTSDSLTGQQELHLHKASRTLSTPMS